MGRNSVIGSTRATKLKVGGLLFCVVVAIAAPAFGHASFSASATFNFQPNTQGGTGALGSTPPYPPDTNVTIYTRVPNESTEIFNGLLDTSVDIKITVPAGWTDAACGPARLNLNDASTSNTNQPGPVAAGWTCMVETSGPNTVLHWTGPQSVPAVWFEFTVTTPSPDFKTTYNGTNGTEGFIVEQTYASGRYVRWIPNAAVPGGGIVAGGLARTVAGQSCNGLPATIVGPEGGGRTVGTAANDVIVGRDANSSIYGLGGDDVICGGDGNDIIDAGAGNDWVDGGAGNDRVIGGNGNDDTRGGDGSDRVFGMAGNDQLDGGANLDYCYGGAGTNGFSTCEVFPQGMS